MKQKPKAKPAPESEWKDGIRVTEDGIEIDFMGVDEAAGKHWLSGATPVTEPEAADQEKLLESDSLIDPDVSHIDEEE